MSMSGEDEDGKHEIFRVESRIFWKNITENWIRAEYRISFAVPPKTIQIFGNHSKDKLLKLFLAFFPQNLTDFNLIII